MAHRSSTDRIAANTEHVFIQELAEHAQVSIIRAHIYPDGGLARLRLFGELTPESSSA